MIVKSVLLDKKRYHFTSEKYCNRQNAFTILVGSNGTGKSRLLKRIVNNIKNVTQESLHTPANYSQHMELEYNNRQLSIYSTNSESKSYLVENKKSKAIHDKNLKVLAVTTTPFDKFPIESKGKSIFRYHDSDNYKYIGLRVSKNTLNQSNYLNLLARSCLSKNNDSSKVLSLLNLKEPIEITFKSKILSPTYTFNDNFERIKRAPLSIDAFSKKLALNHITIYDNICNSSDSKAIIKKAYDCYVRYYMCEYSVITPGNKDIPTDSIVYLLDLGLINVDNITFTTIDDVKLSNSDLSSGQKCMILTILNIAGDISDNCIVCIDEPEISLHPKWQKEFMKTLIDFFSGYKRCHFIIATHSPLIISELSNENCFILNMDNTSAKDTCNYKNKSSDFQLAEVFGITGHNNEYLNRVTVSLLSKLSKSGKLDSHDKSQAKSLIKLSEQMDNGDTVKELINILSHALKKV